MNNEEALDLVRAWRDTLQDDIDSGARRFGGKASVRESAEALGVVLALADGSALRAWIGCRRSAHGPHAGDERFAGGYVACLDDLEAEMAQVFSFP